MSHPLPADPAASNPDNDPPQPGNLPIPVRDGEILRPVHDNWLARAIRTLFGWRSGSLRADLQVVLETSEPDEGSFSTAERTMLRNILNLRERRVADVMIPRADVIAVKQDIALGELMRLFESAGHSRLVVFRDTLDDPEGMVHIRDLLAYITSRAQIDPQTPVKRKKALPANLDLRSINLAMPLSDISIIRKLLYVPPSMPALDLLARMQASRTHLALVVDEYGGTDGLVSIEDLVEEIVGEIDDEHDSQEPPSIVKQTDGSFIADARAPIEDVTTVVGEQFDIGELAESVDTLGGYLVAHVGRLPVRGEVISGPEPFEIEVLDADPRRVKRLRISLRKERVPPRTREGRRRDAGTDSTATPKIDMPEPPPTADTPPSADTTGTS
jgi:CBS domain containing-hemolysin-like protein